MISLDRIIISTIRSGKGDCIHINYDGHNIIVDTGPTSTAGQFRKLCNSILAVGEELDALIITHYDDDHIGGILKVGDLGFKNIYFNAYDGSADNTQLSAIQNQRLFHVLPAAIVHSSVIAGNIIEIEGAKIIVYNPDDAVLADAKTQMKIADEQLAATDDWIFSLDELMERPYPISDKSISNRASIVFSFEYDDKKVLFCGDAWADSIPGGSYDLVKLPHHGSIRNISDKMIDSMDTHSFLICADGTRHPNTQTIAKLLSRKDSIIIYSNYEWWMNGFIRKEDMEYINSGRLVFRKT